MAGGSNDVHRQAAIERALRITTEAMDILDAHRGPAEAAAHLELARQHLRQELIKLKE